MVEETRSVTDLLLVIPTHLSTIPDVGDLYANELHILKLESDLHLLNILMQRFQNVNEDIFEDLNNLKTQRIFNTK